jgi:Icc-related predicted phosphoesterase
MKIVCISDTHGFKIPDERMPDGDLLIHAGDLTMAGRLDQLVQAAKWLDHLAQKYENVICIAGNHDFSLEAFMKEDKEKELRERIFRDNAVHYLRDSGVTIRGISFYGSPWQPWFWDWAFNEERGLAIKKHWDKIPLYTNVLITHGPPMGILDRVGPEHVGCADLRNRVYEVKPTVHVFGHIHCGYGLRNTDGSCFINASQCDEAYKLTNAPIVVEI